MTDSDIRVCAVCTRVLNEFVSTDTGERTYVHGGPGADHLAVPVDPSSVASVEEHCDFCYVTPAPWMFPADNFQDPNGDWSHGGFGACTDCHALIMADDHEALALAALRGATRTLTLDPRQHDEILAMIRVMHDGFRSHRTGPPTYQEHAVTAPEMTMDQMFTKAPNGAIDTLEAIERFTTWREYLCANDVLGNGGDTPPIVEFWRNGRLAAHVICDKIDRDDGLALIANGARMFDADTIVGCFDTHYSRTENNPFTGKPWEQGEMQNACDEHGACDLGVITDALSIQRITKEDGLIEMTQLPYHVHMSSHTVAWIGIENFRSRTLIPTEEEKDRGDHPAYAAFHTKEGDDITELRGRVPDGFREGIRGGSGGNFLAMAPMFGVGNPDIARIHGDCAVAKVLMSQVDCSIMLNPATPEEQAIVERSMARTDPMPTAEEAATSLVETIAALSPGEREVMRASLLDNCDDTVKERIESLFIAAEATDEA